MYANISLCAPTVEKPFRENAPKYSDAPSIYTIYTIILQFVPYVYTHTYTYTYIYIYQQTQTRYAHVFWTTNHISWTPLALMKRDAFPNRLEQGHIFFVIGFLKFGTPKLPNFLKLHDSLEPHRNSGIGIYPLVILVIQHRHGRYGPCYPILMVFVHSHITN